MADSSSIFIAVGGVLAGAGLMWVFARQRLAAGVAEAESRVREEGNAERLSLSMKLASAEERAGRVAVLEAELALREKAHDAVREAKAGLDARVAELAMELKEEREQAGEKLALLHDAQKVLTAQFESLSLQALNKSGEAFLNMAKAQMGEFQEKASGDLAKKEQAIAELLKPVRESLAKVDAQMQEVEKTRAGAYEGLLAQVKGLGEAQQALRGETGRLASVLRSTGARGRWGEIQLRRVVELAGMQDHCDFYEQQSAEGEGGRLRPDMLVKMPGGKTVVVDAKVPFSAYDRAISAEDDATRTAAYREHAAAVREHIKALSGKGYVEQFGAGVEFVVMFLPAETFFGAAVEHDPGLIEFSAERNVMLTTPMTLIALLRAVHYGWRQEKLAENAKQISDLGGELYKRVSKLGDHFARLGKSLGNAVNAYNDAVGSMERSVLPQARKFKELHAAQADREVPLLDPLEHSARVLQAPEFLAGTEGTDGNEETPPLLP